MHCIVISRADKIITYMLTALISFLLITVIIQHDSRCIKTTGCFSKENRISYFLEYGWIVDGDSETETYTVIPESDSKVFSDYNRIQLMQGYNLCGWAGKKVKRYTYSLRNYPGYENSPSMYASVFIAGEKIIASDIKNISADGFIEGVKNRTGNGKTEN